MKNKLPFLTFSLAIALIFMGFSVQGQSCKPFAAETTGPIKILIFSELGECFQVRYRGETLNSEMASSLTFNTASGLQPVKVTMENGKTIEKKLALSPDAATVNYEIKVNKKGKYSLKNKYGQATLTAEAQQKREDDFQAMQDKQEADKAKRDAEWDADRAAAKERMKKNMESDEDESLLSDYDDNREGVQGNAGMEGQQGNAGMQGKQGNAGMEGKQGNAGMEGQQGNSDLGSTNSSSTSSTSSSSTSNSSNDSKITKGKNMFEVQIMYYDAPITGTYLSVLINDHLLGTGLTDASGKTKIYTDYDVPAGIVVELRGEKGNTNWSMDGFYTLNAPPDGTLFPLESAVNQMAEFMGISSASLAQSWGFE